MVELVSVGPEAKDIGILPYQFKKTYTELALQQIVILGFYTRHCGIFLFLSSPYQKGTKKCRRQLLVLCDNFVDGTSAKEHQKLGNGQE